MNKPNYSVRHICVNILDRLNHNGHYADELIAEAFKRHSLPQVDRSLVVELVNGTVRWQGQLDWILARGFRGDFNRCASKLRAILELSLYQIRFLQRIPKYAAVDQGVEIAKAEGGKSWGNLVNAVLRNYLRREKTLEMPSFEADATTALAVRHSHPQWMVQRWLDRYGLEETEELCRFNNQRPCVCVRVNLAKTSPEHLLQYFQEREIEARPSIYFADFIKITRPGDLNNCSAFTNGQFTIQDESTAIGSLLLAPQKGETVLDLCAAPGGKAGHLAQLLGESGRVLAVDQNFNRLSLLQDNIVRLQTRLIRPIVADGRHFQCSPVNKILLDAPCSGLGVLAKRVDLRWRRKPNDIAKVSRLQRSLLQSASRLVKKGGVLVYNTCTLEPEENETVVEDFLDRNGNFRLEPLALSCLEPFANSQGYFRSLPQKHKMDGAFAARLLRIN
ncbi:MAG: 16S rRNA (cytosine(967)-C(5))-methyltransferase RsmB [bacterium]